MLKISKNSNDCWLMVFKSSPIGNEISCVMYGLSEKILNDGEKLKTLLLEGLRRDNFKILEIADYKFQPRGYTVCVLLAESHAAIHTYPEYNSLVFYLYSCREEGDGKKTFEFLKEKLNPQAVDLKERMVKVEDTKLKSKNSLNQPAGNKPDCYSR